VKGKVIHLIVALFQHLIFPVAKGGHVPVGASAGYQLNIRIYHFHQTACLGSQPSVFTGCFVAHLPGAVHLVSKAPEADVMGVLIAVGTP